MRSWSGAAWLRFAIGAWIALAVAASVKTIIEPQLHTVYTAFSHGSRDWWDGNSLYIDRAYYYSPTFAIAMTPFAVWPDWFGGVLWNLASVGLLLWSLRVFFRDVLARQPIDGSNCQDAKSAKEAETRELTNDLNCEPLVPRPSSLAPPLLPARAEGLFHLLVLLGTVRSVWSGQSNAILVALVLFAAAAIVRGRWWRGSLLLAAPVYIKIWPLVAVGLFCAEWPKRMTARVAICAAALGLVPFLTKPAVAVIAAYGDWYHCLINRQATQFRFPGYRDAWTIWEQFQSPVDKRAYLILQVAAGVATLGWCLWQCRRTTSTKRLAIYTIAAWSAWQLLFGPGTERLTYNLIAPALAWGVLAAFDSRRGRMWMAATCVTTYILGLGGMERLLSGVFPAAVALEPIGVLMFAAWLVWHTARRDESTEIGATTTHRDRSGVALEMRSTAA
jgi:Glycosyltransferase family 87